MRLLLATFVLAAPAFAVAQDPIPQDLLAEHNRSCVSECMENRERAYCVQACDCVTAEMRDHWTVEDYERRAAGLSGDEAATVREELNQMAAYCTRQAE